MVIAEEVPNELEVATAAADGCDAKGPCGQTASPCTTTPSEAVTECISSELAKSDRQESSATPTVTAVNVAGRFFLDRNALMEHMRMIQKRVEESGDPRGLITLAEDAFLLFHLATLHPALDKLRSPITGFRYGFHEKYPTLKCFSAVCSDGSESPISMAKCVKEMFDPGNFRKRALNQEQCGDDGRKKKLRKETLPEKTRSEKNLKLIRELAALENHPLAGAWEYPLMNEKRCCFMGHLKCPIEPERLHDFYEKVHAGTIWNQPVDPRSNEPIPRKTAWMVIDECSCTYRYGGLDVEPQKFPDWMSEIMGVYMPVCGLKHKDEWPDSCNLNLYEDGGMSVGWHADDENIFQGKNKDIRIISLSLGQSRTFELRINDELKEEDENFTDCKVKLASGDLCTMEGMTQKYYSHRVPKEKALGSRINLTWRWIARHRQGCPKRLDQTLDDLVSQEK